MSRLRRTLALTVCLSLVLPPPALGQAGTPKGGAPQAGAAGPRPAPAPADPAAAAPDALPGVTLRAAQGSEHARLVLTWPQGTGSLEAQASAGGSLALIRLPRATDLDVSGLATAAPDWIAAAALSADRRTVRIALVQAARIVSTRDGRVQAIDLVRPDAPDPEPVSASSPMGSAGPQPPPAAGAASAGAPAGAAGQPGPLVMHPAPDGAPRVAVTSAVAGGFTRVRLSGLRLPDPLTARRGDRAAFTFAGRYAFDMGQLRARLPERISAAVRTTTPGHTSVVMDVAPGSVLRHRRDGNDLVIDILPEGSPEDALAALQADGGAGSSGLSGTGPAAPATSRAATATDPPMGASGGADPAGGASLASGLPGAPPDSPALVEPAPGGTIPVALGSRGSDVILEFGFEGRAAATVFRRGGAIYVLFASSARVDTGRLPDSRVFTRVTPIQGDGVTGLRLEAPPQVQVTPTALGQRWSLVLSARRSPPGRTVSLSRESAPDGTGRIKATVPDAAATGRFIDPEAGDEVLVGLAYGPASALQQGRSYLEAGLPETAHGLAVIPRADAMELRQDTDGFVLVRPQGLMLSRTDESTAATGFSVSYPGFVDMRAWRIGPAGDFSANLGRLRQAAALEVGQPEKGVRAQLDLARFLLAWELAPEALGVLRGIKGVNPALERTPEVLGLTGAALAQMGRAPEALDVLSQPEVSADPASQLWAAYAAWKGGNAAQARERFERGTEALEGYVPAQRALFRLSDGEAALSLGDPARAAEQARKALADDPPPRTRALATLLAARAAAAVGAHRAALEAIATLDGNTDKEIRARADYARATIGVDGGTLPLPDAIRQLDALRYAWRGDDFEIELLRRLGGLYIQAGDIRSGLATMGSAATLRPDLPAARALRDDLHEQFRRLFLEGGADGMDPIQALALFYDYRHLTPVGPEGDRMVRGLADRLVALDLLPQAAELLKHQVDHRLQGFAKAQVATDLAAIYLLDRKPQEALEAIWASRVATLPEALNSQRRLIEAVAMTELDRNDHAAEILEFDTSPDAARIRAEVFWRAGNHAAAAREARSTLAPAGSRLSPEQAGEVLRAAIASSLAGERGEVAAIAAAHGRAMAGSAFAEAFRVVTGSAVPDPAQLQAAVRAAAGASPFPDLVRRLRERVGALPAPDPAVAAPTGGTGPQAANTLALQSQVPVPGTDGAAVAAAAAGPAAAAAAAARSPAAGRQRSGGASATGTSRPPPRRGETRSAGRGPAASDPAPGRSRTPQGAPALPPGVQAPRDPPPVTSGR